MQMAICRSMAAVLFGSVIPAIAQVATAADRSGPTVTPRGGSVTAAFDELARNGLRVTVAACRVEAVVPADMRFKVVDGRQLVEAVVAGKGLKVAWIRPGRFAAVHRVASDRDVQELARDLNSPDVAVRREAAERSGWIRDIRVLPALLAAASDDDEATARGVTNTIRLRWWPALLATDSLTDAAWKLAEGELARCGKPDFENQFRGGTRLLEAMALAGGERALLNLRKALQSTEPFARRAAVEMLGRLGDRAAVADVEKALTDGEPGVRGAALAALGRLDPAKAVTPAEKALADREATVRAGALAALGFVGGRRAAALAGKALDDNELEVRKAALEALAMIGGPEALALLERGLTDKDTHVRWAAGRALGSAGGHEIVDLLEKKLAGQDAAVRQVAVVALGEVGGPRAMAIIEAALADSDVNIRSAAARALGTAGGERAAELLRKALDDQDAKVRMAAVAAIGLADGKWLTLVEKALNDDANAEVRQAAAYRLASFEALDQTLTVLCAAMKHKDGPVRQAAADVLASRPLGSEAYTRAREALLAAAAVETDPFALDEEVVCLGSWRPKARDILLARLKAEKNPAIRNEIARGMRRVMKSDPQVDQVFKDLNLPADEIKPGQKRSGA